MKKILLLFGFFVVATTGLYAQVGIGTTDPEDSAQLEVWAEDRGVLIPRVDLTDLTVYKPIGGTSEVESLLVYNKNTVEAKKVYPGYYYWYENKWNRIISQRDFSDPKIVKEILKGSNVVVHDGDKFVTYNNDGTKTSVDIVNVINNNTATTKINPGKIKPGANKQVLITKEVSAGQFTVTWANPSEVAVKGEAVKGGKGVEINGLKELDEAVLKTFTITVKDLGIDQIKADLTKSGVKEGQVITVGSGGTLTSTKSVTLDKLAGSTDTKSSSVVYVDKEGNVKQTPAGEKGTVLTTKDDGTLEWKKLGADNIESSSLSATTDGGLELTGNGNGEGVLLGKGKDVTLKIKDKGVATNKLADNAVTTDKINNGAVTNDKLGTGAVTNDKIQGNTITKDKLVKPGQNNAVLKTNKDGDVEWGKITASDIASGKLTVDAEEITLTGDGSDGNGVLLKSTTLKINKIDIAKVAVKTPTDYKGKLLTVNDRGQISPTTQLPEKITVKVNQIKGEDKTSSPGTTATRVVVLKKDGTATSVTIQDLVSSTVQVGNGLSKKDGKIVLGGELSEPKTTIAAAKDKELAIKGLTNTSTITDKDKVVVLGEGNVMHTISATSFKGSGDYVVNNGEEAKAVVTGNVMKEAGRTLTEKMVTIPIEITSEKPTNSIHKGVVASMAGFGNVDYSDKLITEIRVFSKDKITIETSDKGKKKTAHRRISFLAATLEESGADTVITPNLGGNMTAAIRKGHYYVVIKYVE